MQKNDSTVSIAELKTFIADFRKARGWQKYNDPYAIAIALSIEASEILELLLWSKDDDIPALIKKEPLLKARLAEESADVFSNILILSNALNLDLSEAFYSKMAKNAMKYPVGEGSLVPRKRWLE